MGKWYVMHNGCLINMSYSADKLGEALELAKIYKSSCELKNGRTCRHVTVVKCGGVPLQHHVDDTQTHYV